MRVNSKNGGGRGIRTPAGFDSPVGFQDRSLQPNLGIPPYQTRINLTRINKSCQHFRLILFRVVWFSSIQEDSLLVRKLFLVHLPFRIDFLLISSYTSKCRARWGGSGAL